MHKVDINAGSKSQVSCIGVPKYLMKCFIKVLQTSGAVVVFVGSTTKKFETSQIITSINLNLLFVGGMYLKSMEIFVSAGVLIFILLRKGLLNLFASLNC